MWNKWIITLATTLLITTTSSAIALPEDRNQPIHVNANSATLNEKTGQITYVGSVKVVQGSMIIIADKVDVYRKNGDVDRMIATGNGHFQQQPSKEKPVTHAYGKKIDYGVKTQLVNIVGDAKVVQDKDTFTGKRIEYQMDKAIVKAFSDKKSGQRVNMVIQPKSTQQ